MSHSDSDDPDHDVVVVRHTDISDFNPENILPESPSVQASIIGRLSPTEYANEGSEYQKHLSFHLAGSCGWIFSTAAYQQWHSQPPPADEDVEMKDAADHPDEPGNILWVRGVAGSGKSVLASALIRKLHQEEKCPVLYFFFRHGIMANHSPAAALRDWLAQVLPFSPPLQAELKQYIKDHDARSHQADVFSSLTVLFGFLRSALEHLPKIYVFVDALDEMDQESLGPFLQRFNDLAQWRPRQVKLVMTSRPIAVIAKMMRSVQVLDIPLDKRVESDVAAYVRHRLTSSWVPVEDHPRVTEAILSRCDGLFLYAKLAMDRVLERRELDRDTLAAFPTGLSVMYSNILREESERTDIPSGMQQLILKCVTHATRPLRLLEISDLINVTQDSTSSGGDLGVTKSLVRLACGPLLQILPDETVHVAHYSVTEFLNGSTTGDANSSAHAPAHIPGPTHNAMALLCISYLKAGCLGGIRIECDDIFDVRYIEPASRQAAPPFLLYAALNWHAHARKAMLAGHDQSEVNEEVLGMFKSHETLEKVSLLTGAGSKGSTPLGLATYVGLTSLVKDILERASVEKTPIDKEGPLQHAAQAHEDAEIVRLLLEHGADPTAYNDTGSSALHLAVSCKRHQTVKVLLDAGVSAFIPNGENKEVTENIIGGRSRFYPAHLVFSHGDAEMVSIFLPHLKTAKSANWALGTAVKNRRHDITGRLLEHPHVEINAKVSPCTPLYTACSLRDPKAVEMLLKAGADPNIVHNEAHSSGHDPEKEGYNVLHALAGHGYPFTWLSPEPESYGNQETRRCFKLVLDAGARLDQVDMRGLSPLHVARDPIAVSCLLDAGIDPNVATRHGETLLHLTSDPEIMRVLAPRVNINARAQYHGATPLLSLLMGMNFPTEDDILKVSQLLDFGADATAIDDQGNGTLHHAVMAVRELKPNTQGMGISLLNRLIAGGADVNLKNDKGKTPTHLALPGGSPRNSTKDSSTVLEVLVAAGTDLEARDHEGRTPLFQMMQSEYGFSPKQKIKVAEELAAAGASIDTTDAEGRNLLHCTVSTKWPGVELIRFLVGRGIDPQQTDGRGNTIWHLSAPKLARGTPKNELVSELVSMNLDPQKANNAGETPMHIIVKFDPSPFGPCNSVSNSGRGTNEDDPCFFDHFIGLCKGTGSSIIDCVDNNGVTPLHIASTFSEYLTRRLLEEGANITRQTSEGLTVLHLAARSRQTNVLGLLLAWLKSSSGAVTLSNLINTRDSLDRPALYYACASGRPETVQMLLDAGASVNASSYAGSPWQGCVALQDEEKNAKWRWCPGVYDLLNEPDAAGVLISDTRRTRLYPNRGSYYQSERLIFLEQRLDEIVELLAQYGGGGQHLDQALASAVEKKFDHATECLLRARENLDANGPYVLDEETSARLLSRTLAPGKPSRYGDSVTTIIMAERQYWLLKAELLQNPSDEILHRLVIGGFAKLLDQLASREDDYGLPAGDGSAHTQCAHTQTFLVAACRHARWNMNVVRLLVEKFGVDLNAGTFANIQGQQGKSPTALHVLVRGGRWWQVEEALPYLLARGADTEARDERGVTPLAAALESIEGAHFSRKAVETLLQFGADPNAADSLGKSCLTMTVGNSDIYQLLVRHGATVSPSTMVDIIMRRDVSLLEASLASGVDPNMRKIPKMVPEAELLDREEDIWAERGSDPSDDLEHYPLELAVRNAPMEMMAPMGDDEDKPSERMLKLLLEHGANPSARYETTTVMHRLLDLSHDGLNGKPWLLDILLNSPRLDLEARDNGGRTVLHLVASQRLPEFVDEKATTQVLLDAGADVRASDNLGMTVLHHMLRRDCSPFYYGKPEGKNPDISSVIEAAPELIHSVDNQGRTPLHTALDGSIVSREDLFAVIEAGSDISSSVESTGDTVLHLLFRGPWIVELDGEVRVGETSHYRHHDRPRPGSDGDDDDKTRPSEQKDESVIQRLLAKGSLDVNARNKQGKTPIFGLFENDNVSAEVVPSSNERRSRFYNEETAEKRISLEREELIWKFLDDLGVDWTATSETGATLLHAVTEASEMNSKRRVKRFQFLVEKGLDVMKEDNQHRTPLDVTAATGREEILALFK